MFSNSGMESNKQNFNEMNEKEEVCFAISKRDKKIIQQVSAEKISLSILAFSAFLSRGIFTKICSQFSSKLRSMQ